MGHGVHMHCGGNCSSLNFLGPTMSLSCLSSFPLQPDQSILNTIKAMHDDNGLEVHGLLVAPQVT